MTFDEAFNAAAGIATVSASQWAPAKGDPSFRIYAVEVCRQECEAALQTPERKMPTRAQLRSAIQRQVGFGPLTWLWVAVMVMQLLNNLRDWWRNQ